jgi:hypothetical protein
MRRFLPLVKILLVAAVAAWSPLAMAGAPHAIPAVAAAPQVATMSSIVSSPSLVCILPQCDGPYCRGSNGCLVCCTH